MFVDFLNISGTSAISMYKRVIIDPERRKCATRDIFLNMVYIYIYIVPTTVIMTTLQNKLENLHKILIHMMKSF